MNNNILPSDEFIEYEGQFYTNPQKGLEEQNSFIDNLRNVQNANNAEINAQTYNLGTAVPSNLGGLVGGEGYFTSRYQTPQSTSLAANLRATAQAQALNDILSNELAMQKQRYNNAYKAARKRAVSYGGGGSTTGGNNENTSGWDGEVETISTDTTTDTDNNNINTEANAAPPNPNDFYITGEEQTQKIQERSGMPSWLVNVLKIFG